MKYKNPVDILLGNSVCPEWYDADVTCTAYSKADVDVELQYKRLSEAVARERVYGGWEMFWDCPKRLKIPKPK